MKEHQGVMLGAGGKEFVLCPEDGEETLKNTLHLSSQSQGTSPHIEIPVHQDPIAVGI